MLKIKDLIFMSLVLVLFSLNAQATIVLDNPGFEISPMTTPSQTSLPSGSLETYSWVSNSSTKAYFLHEDKNSDYIPETPEGSIWMMLYTQGTSIGHTIADTSLIGSVFDVSYIISKRANEGVDVNHNVMIIAGTSATYVGGEVLATTNYNTDLPAHGSGDSVYNDVSLSLTTVGTPLATNDTLWLVIENDCNNRAGTTVTTTQLLVDDFAVAVPEPMTLALLGIGGIAVLKRKKN
jgi:hypothetical protein